MEQNRKLERRPTMNNDHFQRFEDTRSAPVRDFRLPDPYRWVRYGIVSLMIGYVILILAGVYFTFGAFFDVQALTVHQLLFLLGVILVAAFFFVVGCCVLPFSPQASERKEAGRFLICYGTGVVCGILTKILNIEWLEFGKVVAHAYGTHFLIRYFVLLAMNRKSPELFRAANLASKILFAMYLMLALSIFGGIVLGLLRLVALGIAALLLLLFGFFWIKMLWHAYMATRPNENEQDVHSKFEQRLM
jgi:hypothetical protein